jgi:hypothetical protein
LKTCPACASASFAACCKSDHTCGCQEIFFPVGCS